MERSNLEKVIKAILEPIRENPVETILSLLPDDQRGKAAVVLGLLKNPMIRGFLPFQVPDPDDAIRQVLVRVDSFSPEYWHEVQACLEDILDGDEEVISDLLALLFNPLSRGDKS